MEMLIWMSLVGGAIWVIWSRSPRRRAEQMLLNHMEGMARRASEDEMYEKLGLFFLRMKKIVDERWPAAAMPDERERITYLRRCGLYLLYRRFPRTGSAARQLLARYGQDRGITEMLDNYDFYILPIVNPDGMSSCPVPVPSSLTKRRVCLLSNQAAELA